MNLGYRFVPAKGALIYGIDNFVDYLKFDPNVK